MLPTPMNSLKTGDNNKKPPEDALQLASILTKKYAYILSMLT
jgi:hypothetical protein